MVESLFTLLLHVDDYSIIVLNDLVRMFSIQLFSQLIYSYMNNVVSLSPSFLENTSYILLSLIIYWFIINRIFYFTNRNDGEKYGSNLPQYLRIR